MANEDVILRFGGEVQGLSDALSKISGNLSQFASNVASIQDKLNRQTAQAMGTLQRQADDSARKLEASLKSVGSQVASVGTRLTALISLPVAAAFAASVKSAITFENAFANVRKTVEASDHQLDQLQGQIRAMAREIPKSTEELSNIAAMAGQMGVEAEKIADFTKQVAALGVAVDGISTEDAAMGLAQIGAVTGEGSDKVAEMASALVNLGNAGNSTEGQILDFTKRLVGTGHQIRLTTDQIMGIGSTMASLGINAEAGGTAFSQVMSKMAKAVANGGDQLEGFARIARVSAADFAATFKAEPIKAIQLFVDGLATAQKNGENLYALFGDMGAEGARMTDVLLRMAGSGKLLGEQLQVSAEGWQAQNKHLVEAEKKYATSANQLKLFWQNLKDIGITIGDAVLPALNGLLAGLRPVVDRLADMATAFTHAPGIVQGFGLALTALVVAGGPMIIFTGKVIEGAGQIMAFRRALAGLSTATAVTQITNLGGALTTLSRLLPILAPLLSGALVGAAAVAAFAVADAMLQKTLDGLEAQAARTKLLAEASKVAGHQITSVAEATDLLKRRSEGLLTISDAQVKALTEQSGALRDGTTATIDLAKAFGNVGKQASDVVPPMSQVARAIAENQRRAKEYAEDLKTLGATGLAAVTSDHQVYGLALDKLAEKYGVHEASLERYFATLATGAKGPLADLKKKLGELDEQVRTATANGAAQNVIIEQFGDEILKATIRADMAGERVPAALRKIADAAFALDNAKFNAIAGVVGKVPEGSASNDPERFDAWKTHFDAIEKANEEVRRANMSALAFELDQLRRQGEEKKKLVDKSVGDWRQAYAAIDAATAAATNKALITWREHTADVKAQLNTWPNLFKGALAGFPTMLQSALTGGGGLGGALQGITSSLMGGIGEKGFTSLFNKMVSSDIVSKIGFGATSALGTIMPGLGNVLGSLAGPLLSNVMGKLFGPSKGKIEGQKADQEIDSLKQKLLDTYGTLENIKRVGGEAGEALAAAWGSKNVAGLAHFKSLLEQFNTKIQDQQALTDALQQKQEMVNAAIQRYGFTIDELGPKFRSQQLAEQAEQLLTDYQLLIESGIANDVVIQRMSGSINEFVAHALRTGTEIPIAMKPMLEAMVAQGTLTDANGQKLTDLSKIQFGETLTQGFSRIIDKLNELIAKLSATASGINQIPEHKRSDIEIVETHRRRYEDETDDAEVHHSGGIVGDLVGRVLRPAMSYSVFAHARRYHRGGLAVDEVPAILKRGEGVLNPLAMRTVGPEVLHALNRGASLARSIGLTGAPAFATAHAFAPAGGPLTMNVNVDARGSYFPDRAAVDELGASLRREFKSLIGSSNLRDHVQRWMWDGMIEVPADAVTRQGR